MINEICHISPMVYNHCLFKEKHFWSISMLLCFHGNSILFEQVYVNFICSCQLKWHSFCLLISGKHWKCELYKTQTDIIPLWMSGKAGLLTSMKCKPSPVDYSVQMNFYKCFLNAAVKLVIRISGNPIFSMICTLKMN